MNILNPFQDFSQSIILENDLVRLEPLTISHTDLLLSVALDPEIWAWNPTMQIDNREDMETYIKQALSEKIAKKRYPFAIFSKKTQQYAGSTSYYNIEMTHRKLTLGHTWFGKEFRKTGLNRNCKFLMLKYAFEELLIERVEFTTDSNNLQSREAMRKIGAIQEGILRHHILRPSEIWRDTIVLSILRSEWQNIKETIFANY
ncbi:MAG: N-acetyltransferase [Bacteroidetes bacterium]|nr:MAG: N-acetyltransferase [Bacteroidota bacterium]